MKAINWKLFDGSSHCSEGLAYFARGNLKTFREFEEYFLPDMKEQAAEVHKMRGMGLVDMRRRAARAFCRHESGSITELYGERKGQV